MDPLRRPADLLLLRGGDRAVHGDRGDPAAGPAARRPRRVVGPADGRCRGRGRLRGPGGAQLRLVLAHLHRPAPHHGRVAATDLVQVLDLTGRRPTFAGDQTTDPPC